MTSLLQARRATLARLTAAEVPDAGQDAALLLAHALGVTRAELALLSAQAELTRIQETILEQSVVARTSRKPMSHITGQRLFWGRAFEVTPDVLDPRPETETLIAAALEQPFTSVLDLGTGSGCILLTLLLERPTATGLGVDLSAPALVVAQRNQARLAPQARLAWAQGSWFDAVAGQFDLIVSNPPYIAVYEMAALAPEVRDWEPHLALTPGGDGLEAYRQITAGARQHLTAKGRLMVEVGASQGGAVSDIFAAAGFVDIQILPDLDGRDRVVAGGIS